MMKSKITLIHILILNFLVEKRKTLFYAIDTDDGNGLQIFERVRSNCHFYKKFDNSRSSNLHLHLLFKSGQWMIIKNLYPKDWDEWSCSANGGEILYQQEGEKPNSEGWYDFSKNQTDAVLSVYALEECSIYSGANVKVDKFWGVPKYFPNGDLDSCLKDAFSTNWVDFQLVVTTSTWRNGQSALVSECQYQSMDYTTGGKIIISSDDEKAQIYFGDTNCYNNKRNGHSPPFTMHIREAFIK